MTSWAVDEAGVVTRGGDPVTAGVVFENQESIRSALGLRFSNLTVSMVIEISGIFPDGLVLRVGVEKNAEVVHCSPDVDQQVIEGTWHAVEPGSKSQVSEFLARHGATEGPMTAGLHFELVADPVSVLILRDAVEHTPGVLGSPLPPPPDLEAVLFPYQLSGSTQLRRMAGADIGCLLADEMGLGKTLQVVTLLTALPPGSRRTLVVAPRSILFNWESELKKFSPLLTTRIHAGEFRPRVVGRFDNFDVTLVSYETLVQDLVFIREIEWDVVVLDEAQKIRNPDTRRAEAVKELRCRIPIAVTGTPVENGLQDLWSIAEFVIPPLLGSRPAFEENFPDEVSAARRLGQLIKPITIRRRVADVAGDLPEKTEFVVPLELIDEDRERYEAIGPAVLASHASLRVLCSHGQHRDELRPPEFGERTKVEHLLSILEELFENGQKALVFTEYVKTLKRLVGEIGIRWPAAFVSAIYGATSPDDRPGILEDFESHQGPGCLVMNPTVAGAGLNIQSANHVIHFTPGYNPAVTRQATARAWRVGQQNRVFVHHLYYKGTVEEDALMISEIKRGLADGVDDGVEASTSVGENV